MSSSRERGRLAQNRKRVVQSFGIVTSTMRRGDRVLKPREVRQPYKYRCEGALNGNDHLCLFRFDFGAFLRNENRSNRRGHPTTLLPQDPVSDREGQAKID